MAHNPGDLLWLNRHPGGWCLFLQSEYFRVEGLVAYEMYTVVHPTDGVIEDADWYFTQHRSSEE